MDAHAIVSLLRSEDNVWESFQYIGPSQGWNLVTRLGFKCLQLPMWNLQEVLWVCNRPAQPVLCAQTSVVGPLANTTIFPTEVAR